MRNDSTSGVPAPMSPGPTPGPAQDDPLKEDKGFRRYLALWFPFLSTDRMRGTANYPRTDGPDEQPFVLVEKDRGALRICAVDATAARLGLSAGTPLAKARAVCPNIEALPADPAADVRALNLCAELCEMFTPLVATQGADGLLLDITGCAHLFGGETGLIGRARRRMADLGLASCAAIAGTPDCAWALAHRHRNMIVAPGEEETIARALPLAALDRDAATTLALTRAGFQTLDDLASRPSAMLTARFGEGLATALRRVLGREDIRITPLRPAPEIMAEKHFPEPLGLMDSLLAALERLAGDVATALERRGAGGRVFEASFFRSDGVVRRIAIETALATRDTASLLRLIRLKIEALADPIDPGFGFDALRLAVVRSESLAERQEALDQRALNRDRFKAQKLIDPNYAEHSFCEKPVSPFSRDALEGGPANTGSQADSINEIAQLVDRLVARFGRENVRRFVAQDTHDPVRAGGTAPWLSAQECGSLSQSWISTEPGQPPARPLTLFDPPQFIEALAEVPDGPPLRFRWRRILHEVARAEGPERIAPEWWRAAAPAPATRDYYRIENAQGHRFWVFREGGYEDTNARPRWFLHGLFA